MANDSMPVVAGLRKGEASGADWLREAVRGLVQEMMEAEVRAQIGAGRYERSDERTAYRNGHRLRPWDTRLGTVELAIPKLRTGSYFPSFLEPRRRAEQALVAAEEIRTFYDFPLTHRRQIYSTDPLEMASSQSTIAA